VLQDDVGRERETVSALKSTISQLSTAQLSVTTQKDALQAQIGALQALLDESTCANAQLRLVLESAEKKCEGLEREAEGVRRKLHNMVQELKGNIRVFCRVRPVLPSDLASCAGDEPQTTLDNQEKLREAVQASMAFPDKRDHKEIVLSSSSESAMGQEKKEVYNFGFDRVWVFWHFFSYADI
jgi:kinesin family protein C1